MIIQHRWKTIQTDCQDSVKGDNGCSKEVKITTITGNKFWDYDNQPFNTMPLNISLTIIRVLKNPHTVLKTNPPGSKLSRSFTCLVRFVTWLIIAVDLLDLSC